MCNTNQYDTYHLQSLNVGLDRLTLTVNTPSSPTYKKYIAAAINMAKMEADFTFAGAPHGSGYRASVRLIIPGVEPNAHPTLQIAPYSKTAFFRLECNPNHLGVAGIEAMKSIIDTNTPQGWPLFMHSATVSRVDANIDAQGIPLHRLVLGTKYPRVTEIWSVKGELNEMDVATIYLGSKASSDSFYRCYRLPVSKIATGCEVATRFENVDEVSRPKLMDLHKYQNPFGKLFVGSTLAPKPKGWDPLLWEMTIRIATDHGLNAALHYLSSDKRKQAKQVLSVPPYGIDLMSCWEQWPGLIAKLGLQTSGIGGPNLSHYSIDFDKAA
jgi:hypothetical protein